MVVASVSASVSAGEQAWSARVLPAWAWAADSALTVSVWVLYPAWVSASSRVTASDEPAESLEELACSARAWWEPVLPAWAWAADSALTALALVSYPVPVSDEPAESLGEQA